MLKNKIKKLLVKLGLFVTISISVFIGGSMKCKTVYADNLSKYTTQQLSQMMDLNEWIKDKDENNNKVEINKKLNVDNDNKVTYNENVEQNINNKYNQISNQQINQSKGRVLIYSTHSCEKNVDSTVIDVAEDLANKFREKGYVVDHDKSDFANENGYNKAYYSSAKMLDGLDLSVYSMILDLHFDSTPNPVATKDINGNDVARLMFPNLSENPNLEHQTNLVNKIRNGLNEYGEGIYKENVTHYKKGISFYSLNKNENMLLIEVGSDKNSFDDCSKSMTYFVDAVDKAIVN